MSDVQSKLAQLKATAEKQLTDCGVSNIDHEKLDGYVNSLKTMVDNKDAVLVSGLDASELETVRRNFVEKKLGVTDKDKAMAAITSVVDKMSGIKMKNRPAFYYLVSEALS
ncbi:conserved hypothetical protein (DUF2853) [Formosa agariphila KMM 3901]|uniref:DUF2853 family protein n=1 Tax=Formosa agariphila (strain DSM 15362 / KCTC 12365 / LMG 23005 / KMM 3901 / M-2Alg 35-1) TaxID=1347342 RepID=T2KHL1_FORAG|nr:DUF2853 family protein [Formosa agariphila]CDF77911.1 conserved hypothetical protein (DUF2853) [Formosa agariphila KMM 3901]